MPSSNRRRRRPVSDINVVPYIDVMLVLLVIFMVTAPLLYQGVEIDLPQASADPIPPQERDPIIVEVDSDGNYYLSIGTKPGQPISTTELMSTVAAAMRADARTPVLVKGDAQVPYGRVVRAMAELQAAGVPKVGLMTEPDQ